jgi:hypothetical protein
VKCSRCGNLVQPDDTFCGSCGLRVSDIVTFEERPAGEGSATGLAERPPTDSGQHGNGQEPAGQVGVVPEAMPPGPLFGHAGAYSDGRVTNATRYLCAAAYLDPAFSGRVIRELVSSHRAVAPSIGIDLEPIVRHCLRARTMQLVRDVLLVVLLLVGLYLETGLTILALFAGYFFGFLPSVDWTRKSLTVKVVAVIGTLFAVFIFVDVVIALALSKVLSTITSGIENHLGTGGFGGSGQSGFTSPISLTGLCWLAAIVVVQVTYTWVRSRTLCNDLVPDAAPASFRPNGQQTEERIRQISSAQYGNLFLYSGANPFVGAGKNAFVDGKNWGRTWSIAIEMQRASGGRLAASSWPNPPGEVTIDPVELHQVIRQRLLRLNGADLPPNERLSGLSVSDHIVGLGRNRWDSPYMDPVLHVPYSQASQEAVDALIRHPQAGLRYYQRFSVCDEGQAVYTSGNDKVIDRSDQDISASAFVYVAVEGRMFYLEFVSAVMPPVSWRYGVVDLLPKVSAGAFFGRVLADSFRLLFQDLFYATARLWRMQATRRRERRAYRDEAEAAREYLYGDVGSRMSVREAGSSADFMSYIQELDAEKYTKLAERLINDTVLDYLAGKGIDTSAYAASAATIVNGTVFVGDNTFYGPVATGGQATQHNVRQPGRG